MWSAIAIAWSVCLYTFVRPAKATGRNEMPFGRDTRVVSSNIVQTDRRTDRATVTWAAIGEIVSKDLANLVVYLPDHLDTIVSGGKAE